MKPRRMMVPVLAAAIASAAHAGPFLAPEGAAPSAAAREEGQVRQEMRRYFKERLRADLALTDEQASRILPKVEAIEKDRVAERRERREATRRMRSDLRAGAPDATLERDLERLERIPGEHRARVQDLIADIDRELTVRQRVELRFLIADFRMEMARGLREMRRGPQGRDPGRRFRGPDVSDPDAEN